MSWQKELTKLKTVLLSKLQLQRSFFILWCAKMRQGREREPLFCLLILYLMLDGRSGSKIVHVILVNGAV